MQRDVLDAQEVVAVGRGFGDGGVGGFVFVCGGVSIREERGKETDFDQARTFAWRSRRWAWSC
jgi:hypothetical protein